MTLPELVAEANRVDARLRERVRLLISRRVTWAEIGKALNISRQAAWDRFGRSRPSRDRKEDVS